MSNPIVIINSGLVKLGANTIVTLEDGTKESNLATTRFDECRIAVLRRHNWSSAVARVVLAPSDPAPAYGYAYGFTLPSDYVRTVMVNPETESDFKIESGRIVGDFTVCYLKYISSNPSLVATYDQLLVEAMAAYFAWDVCYSITQSLAVKQQMEKEYQTALSKAKLASSQEMPSPEVEANYFLEARLGPVAANIAEKRNW